MKLLLLTTIAIILLAGCRNNEIVHESSDNKIRPIQSVHPYQKIIGNQEAGTGSKESGIRLGNDGKPARKRVLPGTNLVEMLKDHLSRLKSSPGKFSGSNAFLPNIPELIDHWKKEIKETNEPEKRLFLKLKLIDELTRCNGNEEALKLIYEVGEFLETSMPEQDGDVSKENLGSSRPWPCFGSMNENAVTMVFAAIHVFFQ